MLTHTRDARDPFWLQVSVCPLYLCANISTLFGGMDAIYDSLLVFQELLGEWWNI